MEIDLAALEAKIAAKRRLRPRRQFRNLHLVRRFQADPRSDDLDLSHRRLQDRGRDGASRNERHVRLPLHADRSPSSPAARSRSRSIPAKLERPFQSLERLVDWLDYYVEFPAVQ
ncbi:MAG: hypothetical protein MZW92_02480 [Comamonadaceae bacterium]|nr:hypothetical protein [Comamonadaceae bacterium]